MRSVLFKKHFYILYAENRFVSPFFLKKLFLKITFGTRLEINLCYCCISQKHMPDSTLNVALNRVIGVVKDHIDNCFGRFLTWSHFSIDKPSERT